MLTYIILDLETYPLYTLENCFLLCRSWGRWRDAGTVAKREFHQSFGFHFWPFQHVRQKPASLKKRCFHEDKFRHVPAYMHAYMYMPLYIQINRYGIYEYWNVWILCTCICQQRENHASVLTFFDVHHVSIFEVGVRGWGGNKVRSAFMHVTLHACHMCTCCCTTSFLLATPFHINKNKCHAQGTLRYLFFTCRPQVRLTWS